MAKKQFYLYDIFYQINEMESETNQLIVIASNRVDAMKRFRSIHRLYYIKSCKKHIMK